MKRILIASFLLIAIALTGFWVILGDDSPSNLSGEAKEEAIAKRRAIARQQKRENSQVDREASAKNDKLSEASGVFAVSGEDDVSDGSTSENQGKSAGGKESLDTRRSERSSSDQGAVDRDSTNAKSSAQKRAAVLDATFSSIAAGDEEEEVEKDELKVLASKKWTAARIAKRFTNRGQEAPKRIMTELSGKIMVHGISTGLPNARVILHSFFPETNRPTDQLIPVITEFTTDENGFFNGKVPLPERYPETHAVLTISVFSGAEGGNPNINLAGPPETQPDASWAVNGQSVTMDGSYGAGRPLVVGKALTKVVAGEKAALGIFWVSEHTVNFRIDGTAFKSDEQSNAKVSLTGHCDPKRWTADTLTETLATFPSRGVGLSGVNNVLGVADPYGDWLFDGPPNLALHRDGEVLATQRAKVTKKIKEKPEERSGYVSPLDGKTYIMDVIFDGGAGTSISGYVQDAEGLGVEGARVYVAGKSVDFVFSESNGWFFLENRPTDTGWVVVEQGDYVAKWIKLADFEKANNVAVLEYLRPRVRISVLNEATKLPLDAVRANFKFANAWNQTKDGELDLPRDGDAFRFDWTERVTSQLELSADGYSAVKVSLPANNDPGEIEVLMRERRRIDVKPNSFAEAESRGDAKWFTLSDSSDDVYTAWSHLTISYDVNFSEDEFYDEEEVAKPFELVVGFRNQGIVDNVYEFQVDVYLDGKKVGRIKARADTLNERLASINLGNLKGKHRIGLRWLNDKWIPNELDANIRIASLRFLELPTP